MIKKSSLGEIGGFDFSKKTTPKYRKIKPYEEDIKTGEILNKSLNDIYVEDGETNTYELTQSHKAECDIYEILRNCKASGTLDALGDPDKATYTDTTILPKDLTEAMTKLQTNDEDIKRLTEEYNNLKTQLELAKQEAKEETPKDE